MVNASDFNLLNDFLSMHTYNQTIKYDLILVLGNAVAQIAIEAYKLYKDGHSSYFMIAGGQGHTTDILMDTLEKVYNKNLIKNKSEAELFEYLIQDIFSKDDSIILETKSTNCGENIQFAFQILKQKNIQVNNVLLVHDPLMQRRIDATARHYFPNIHFDNYRCFLPMIKCNEYDFYLTNHIWGLWSKERYLSLLLGEMKRITDDNEGYGPKGKNYIAHVKIPESVKDAYQRILLHYKGYQRQ